MSKDNKVSTLTKATVKAITEIATAQAIKAYNDEKKSDVQKYHDRRYKNTKLLLKNYHKFVEYRNNAIYDASKVEGNVIIAEIMEESPEGNFSVESIKKNVVITHTMLAHIDEMLKVYMSQHSMRSEEHTSELQSRLQLVGRLLLEKKKKMKRKSKWGGRNETRN